MPLQKRRPAPVEYPSVESVPDLTHQSSSESMNSHSPVTPSHETPLHNPLEKPHRFNVFRKKSFANKKTTIDLPGHSPSVKIPKGHDLHNDPLPPVPASAPASTSHFDFKFPNPQAEPESPKVPPKDLAFLSQDPFANPHVDDDEILFDKNQPIALSRSKSGRSIMSTSSMQSLKRGLSTIKRKLTTRSRSRPPERRLRKPENEGLLMPGQQLSADPDGINGVGRTQTFMMGPTLHHPRRVETFQMSAMVI